MQTYAARWATKHRHATPAQINHALADIRDTLDIWRDQNNEYTRKLWSEFDYLIALKHKKKA